MREVCSPAARATATGAAESHSNPTTGARRRRPGLDHGRDFGSRRTHFDQNAVEGVTHRDDGRRLVRDTTMRGGPPTGGARYGGCAAWCSARAAPRRSRPTRRTPQRHVHGPVLPVKLENSRVPSSGVDDPHPVGRQAGAVGPLLLRRLLGEHRVIGTQPRELRHQELVSALVLAAFRSEGSPWRTRPAHPGAGHPRGGQPLGHLVIHHRWPPVRLTTRCAWASRSSATAADPGSSGRWRGYRYR